MGDCVLMLKPIIACRDQIGYGVHENVKASLAHLVLLPVREGFIAIIGVIISYKSIRRQNENQSIIDDPEPGGYAGC